MNNTTWVKQHDQSTSGMATGNLDGDAGGKAELILNLGSGTQSGLWVKYNNSTWTQINTATIIEQVVSGDFDNDGKDDLAVDFGPGFGVFTYTADSTWTNILAAPFSPTSMTVADVDGDGRDDVVADLRPGLGVKVFMNNAVWIEMTANNTENMAGGKIE